MCNASYDFNHDHNTCIQLLNPERNILVCTGMKCSAKMAKSIVPAKGVYKNIHKIMSFSNTLLVETAGVYGIIENTMFKWERSLFRYHVTEKLPAFPIHYM